MANINTLSIELTSAQFKKISGMVYQVCGINLQVGKEGLIKSRLLKRLSALGLSSFDDYLAYLERDRSGGELITMIDALATNKTSFFREAQHFDYLRQHILPKLRAETRRLRIWSAGCSSGEEPYTLGIVLREEWPDLDRRDVRILATDISTKILGKAREASYDQEAVAEVPPSLIPKYFTCVQEKPARRYQVKEQITALVKFARLNLMGEWPMKGPFNMIFCRNVMIYFDKPTQQELVQRFWELLEPGGHLFIGHSESLTSSSRRFQYLQPALYVK
jgi:chemotaxis protein methyltransferase CheR